MKGITLSALGATALYASHFTPACALQDEQIILQGSSGSNTAKPEVRPLSVAIIGAGAAGSSAAYHLSQYALDASLPINVTIFDRNSYIGGRSTTVSAYNSSHPHHTVELGASIFVSVNSILYDAVSTFNLSLTNFNDNPKGVPGSGLGVWDGQKFVLEIDGPGWWDTAKLLWKYGLAPVRTQRLMKSVVGKFLNMYEAPIFPFKSLTQAAQDVGLLAVTAATGEQYMRENGIAGPFGREVVQASTRVNYAQNLGYIHGLEAMVCMATDGAVAVDGGNWKIFEGMVKDSGASILLGTEVRSVKKLDGGGYGVSYASIGGGENIQREPFFDKVIIAGPWQYSNISTDNLQLEGQTPDTIPYVELHVTLFTSPHLLSPTFFGLSPDKATPQVILTTLPTGEPAQQGPAGVGSPGFFSISLLRPIVNPVTKADEYLYKIFSPQPANATFLASILDVQNLPGNDKDSISERDVTWIYRKVWNSYPYEYPRLTFEDAKLDREGGLWYTGGMDAFISTMETNALMGKNVARLLIDGVLEDKDGGSMESGEWRLRGENFRYSIPVAEEL